jgi:hypothetical protein
MRSGAHVEVVAKAMIDDPASTEILFYQDESGHHLAATIRRADIAGLILGPQKSSAIPTL